MLVSIPESVLTHASFAHEDSAVLLHLPDTSKGPVAVQGEELISVVVVLARITLLQTRIPQRRATCQAVLEACRNGLLCHLKPYRRNTPQATLHLLRSHIDTRMASCSVLKARVNTRHQFVVIPAQMPWQSHQDLRQSDLHISIDSQAMCRRHLRAPCRHHQGRHQVMMILE